MSLTYAIPDLHGRIDLLDRALQMIPSHAAGKAARIVTLGDYIDRGPSSASVIERLMTWHSSTLELIALKGNHEAMMWEVCNNLDELSVWLKLGGGETLRSYSPSNDQALDPAIVPRRHLQWIAERPAIHADRFRVFVHAGVDPGIPLSRQSERTLLWKRYPPGSRQGYGKRHVVHGHDADSRAPLVTVGKTNLDGLAWQSGRLVVGIFADDQAGGPVDFLEIT